MPRKKPANKQSVVSFRISTHILKEFDDLAWRRRLGRADYLRMMIEGLVVRHRPADPEVSK